MVLETVNQYQKERGLIFFDPMWEQMYMDSMRIQYVGGADDDEKTKKKEQEDPDQITESPDMDE